MSTPPGRMDNACWRQAKARVLAEEQECGLCGYPLYPGLGRYDPWATQVDHVIQLSMGGDPYARHNLRAVHGRCHSRRPPPARPTPLHPNPPPRVWGPLSRPSSPA